MVYCNEISVMGPLGSVITLNVFYYYENNMLICREDVTPQFHFFIPTNASPETFPRAPLLFVIPQDSPHWLILHTYPGGDVTP